MSPGHCPASTKTYSAGAEYVAYPYFLTPSGRGQHFCMFLRKRVLAFVYSFCLAFVGDWLPSEYFLLVYPSDQHLGVLTACC